MKTVGGGAAAAGFPPSAGSASRGVGPLGIRARRAAEPLGAAAATVAPGPAASMSLPPEKASELKQLIHQQLSKVPRRRGGRVGPGGGTPGRPPTPARTGLGQVLSHFPRLPSSGGWPAWPCARGPSLGRRLATLALSWVGLSQSGSALDRLWCCVSDRAAGTGALPVCGPPGAGLRGEPGTPALGRWRRGTGGNCSDTFWKACSKSSFLKRLLFSFSCGQSRTFTDSFGSRKPEKQVLTAL